MRTSFIESTPTLGEDPRVSKDEGIKTRFSISAGQVELQPERDRVRRAAAERGAAREALCQEERGEDRVHRPRRSR